jgi:hypothetical protein
LFLPSLTSLRCCSQATCRRLESASAESVGGRDHMCSWARKTCGPCRRPIPPRHSPTACTSLGSNSADSSRLLLPSDVQAVGECLGGIGRRQGPHVFLAQELLGSKGQEKKKKPSLKIAIAKAFGGPYFVAGVLKAIYDASSFLGGIGRRQGPHVFLAQELLGSKGQERGEPGEGQSLVNVGDQDGALDPFVRVGRVRPEEDDTVDALINDGSDPAYPYEGIESPRSLRKGRQGQTRR